MDTSTVVLSVLSSLVSGGVIGGVVSLIVVKRESKDRQDALALERTKWEEANEREHSQWVRQRRYETYSALLAAINGVMQAAFRPDDDSAFQSAVFTLAQVTPSAVVVGTPQIRQDIDAVLEAMNTWLEGPKEIADTLTARKAASRLRESLGRELGIPQSSAAVE